MRTLKNQVGLLMRLKWAAVATLPVALAAFYLVGYRPAAGQLADLNASIGSLRSDVSAAEQRAAELPRLALRVETLQAKIDRNGEKLPPDPQLDRFFHDVTQVSQQSSLQHFAMLPMIPRRADLFYEMPICMTFQGDFINAALFLRQVEDLQRLARVRSLKITGKNERSGEVDVEVQMNIYFSES